MQKLRLFYALVTLPFVIAVTEAAEITQYNTQVVFSLEQSELAVDTAFSIPAASMQNSEVQLFLNKAFEVDNISGDTLKSFTVTVSKSVPSWNVVTLKMKDNTAVHDIDISYRGTISADADHGNHITAQSIHLSIDSAWHPIFSDFSTPIQGTLKTKLPRGWVLYGPGTVNKKNESYELVSTQKSIDVSFYAAASRNEVASDRFTVVYDAPNEERAEQLAKLGSQCLVALNKSLGAADTLDTAALVILERPGASFARSDYLSVSSDKLSDNATSYHYVCHELSHHWTTFDDAMSHDYWMMESFAEYVAAREVKAKFGVRAYERVVEAWRQRAEGEAFIWRVESEQRAPANVNYGLGPLALMALERRTGKEVFNKLLRYYITNSLTETEELLARLELLSDRKTREWFERLLRGTNDAR